MSKPATHSRARCWGPPTGANPAHPSPRPAPKDDASIEATSLKAVGGPQSIDRTAVRAHWLIADDARTRRRRRAVACRRGVVFSKDRARGSEDTLLNHKRTYCTSFSVRVSLYFVHQFNPIRSPISQSIDPPPALALFNNQILSRASANFAAAAVSPLRIAPQYSPKVTKSSRPDASFGLPSTAAKRPRISSAHTCGVAHTPPAPLPAARLAAAPPPPPAAGVAASWGASSAATEVTRTVVRQVVSSRRAKPSAEPTV